MKRRAHTQNSKNETETQNGTEGDPNQERAPQRPEACAVAWGKSINEVFEEGFGWVRDAAWFMGEGKEFIALGSPSEELFGFLPDSL